MSPFAAGTWSVVGSVGDAATPASPFNLAYSSSRDILVVGVCGSGAIFSWDPNTIYRSLDKGATWTLAHNFATVPFDHAAPVVLALLRDPDTGAERFVAAVTRITFVVGPIAESAEVRMYYSEDGLTWTAGTLLVSTPGAGAASTGTGVTSVATRPRGGLSAPDLEHYIIARAVRNAVESRGVFKSTDLGLTWTLVGDTAPVAAIGGGNGTTALVTRPNRNLVLGSHQTLAGSAESTDGGQSWTAGSPQFAADYLLAFDPGTLIGNRTGTLTQPCQTRICCTEALGWPPTQLGPTFGLSGAVVTNPVIINLGLWEVLLAAGTSPLGKVDVIYSDNGGETTHTSAVIDSGSGIVQHLSGGVMLSDGRPLIVSGSTGTVFRSSDVPQGALGTRIYCTVAPFPGVGFLEFPAACGPFYNPCPQECPTDPEPAVALLVAHPPDFIPGEALSWGDTTGVYGPGVGAGIYGGTSSVSITYPTLGLLEGCAATSFTTDPCAAEVCP